MKIALMAVLAVVMGTTFTSCLDSDNGPDTFPEVVNIVDFMGIPTVTSDAGYELDVQNISKMKLNDGTYPSRAMVSFERVEGEIYDSGKSSYKAIFDGYYYLLNVGQVINEVEVESLSPINSFIISGQQQQQQVVYGSGKYLNFYVEFTADDNTKLESDIILQYAKVEDGVLYCNVIHKEEVGEKDKKNVYAYMSYLLPLKSELKQKFPDLTFTGEDNNIIEIVLVAEGKNEQELKTEKVKVLIPN